MKGKLIIFLQKYPLFLYLLPVFFVLHGCMENFDFVPAADAMLLTGIYLIASIVLFLLFRFFYKNWLKAGVMASLIMGIHFFFGSMQDALRKPGPGFLLSKYIFLVPALLCILAVVLFVLKKRRKPLHKFALYLNSLLALLILLDGVLLVSKMINVKANKTLLLNEFTSCPQCPRPDVYIIIADEYPGSME